MGKDDLGSYVHPWGANPSAVKRLVPGLEALGGALTHLGTFWGKGLFGRVLEGLGGSFGKVLEALAGPFGSVLDGLGGSFGKVLESFRGGFGGSGTSIWEGLGDPGRSIWDGMVLKALGGQSGKAVEALEILGA